MNWRIVTTVGALMFWGWWASYMPVAIVLALVIASIPWISFRIELDDRQFNRIVDITSVVVFIIGLYLIISDGSHGIFILVASFPILLFPLYASQEYSTRGTISMSSLIMAMRKQQDSGSQAQARQIDIAWSYMAVCAVAASVKVANDPWFFPSLLLLAALTLFAVRPRRYHWIAWMIVLVLAGGNGYAGQIGLRALHDHVEEASVALLESWLKPDREISRSRTAIGLIGELKAEHRIIWQLKAGETGYVPKLLRQASYQTYKHGSWLASNTELTPLVRTGEAGQWRTTERQEQAEQQVYLAGDMRGKFLPAPAGIYQLDRLPAVEVSQSPLGSIIVEDSPEFLDIKMHYTGGIVEDAGPDDKDLELPRGLQPTLAQLVSELGINPANPEESLAKIERFFLENFSYTLFLSGPANDPLPLKTFLLKERKGHCEYFATAGVMMLRAAGIPARYASGYSVIERNPVASNSWIIRSRHSHAWSMAYINGAWQELDYTPSEWAGLEEGEAPWWTTLSDLWTLFWQSLQMQDEESSTGLNYGWWVMVFVLLLIIARWIYAARRVSSATASTGDYGTQLHQGKDSPFYEIVNYLQQSGYGPEASETLGQWLHRLGRLKEPAFELDGLNEVLTMHYSYRFGGGYSDPVLKSELQKYAERWISDQKAMSEGTN